MEKQNFMLWISIAVVNAIVLYVAALVAPTAVVFGNDTVPYWTAIIATTVLLTVVLYLVKPVLKAVNLRVKGDLAINITYAVTNMVGLWVLARLARYIGFGISSFIVAIVLGLVLSAAQFAVWKGLAAKK